MTERVRRKIASQLANGPLWIRSFGAAKPAVDGMVAVGDLVMVQPAGGIARNMVGLTEQGARKYLPALSLTDLTVFEGGGTGPSYYMDQIAEGVSEGRTRASICRELGISESYGELLWKQIRANLGHQAQ